jgi:hypothetical protein
MTLMDSLVAELHVACREKLGTSGHGALIDKAFSCKAHVKCPKITKYVHMYNHSFKKYCSICVSAYLK